MGNLVLSRTVGQVLTIGDDIKITVVDIQHGGRWVRLAIEAPPSRDIVREEAKNKTHKER